MSRVLALSPQHLPAVAVQTALWRHCAALAARCLPGWAGAVQLGLAPPRGTPAGWRLSLSGAQGSLHLGVSAECAALTLCAELPTQALRQAVLELLLCDTLAPLLAACGQAGAALRWRLARRPGPPMHTPMRTHRTAPMGLQTGLRTGLQPGLQPSLQPSVQLNVPPDVQLRLPWPPPQGAVEEGAAPSAATASAAPLQHLDLLGASPAWGQALLAHLRRRAQRLQGLAQTLRLPGQLQLSPCRVALAALRRLRTGDVLLCPQRGASLRQALGGGAWPVCWGDPQRPHVRAVCVDLDATMTLQTPPHHHAPDLSAPQGLDAAAPPPPWSEQNPAGPGAAPDLAAAPAPDATDGEAHDATHDATQDVAQGVAQDVAQDVTPEPAPDPAAPGLRLDLLELPVCLYLEAPAMSLADLAALQPGAVLALPGPLAQARVRLAVHGQTLGHGELVLVGEQLGVRLTRVLAPLATEAP